MPFHMLECLRSFVSVPRVNAIAKRLPHRIVDFEQRVEERDMAGGTTIMRQQMHSAQTDSRDK